MANAGRSPIENGHALNGDAIVAKAHDYAKCLEINDFKGTDGWLSKFKKRYQLRQIVKHGEAGSEPCENYWTSTVWMTHIMQMKLDNGTLSGVIQS